MRPNVIREKLDAGEPTLSTHVHSVWPSEIEALGRRAWCFTEDLREVTRTADLAQSIADACGPVHIVAHFAGAQLRRAAVEMTPDDWERVLAVNLTAPYFLSCRLAERMLAFLARSPLRERFGKLVEGHPTLFAHKTNSVADAWGVNVRTGYRRRRGFAPLIAGFTSSSHEFPIL